MDENNGMYRLLINGTEITASVSLPHMQGAAAVARKTLCAVNMGYVEIRIINEHPDLGMNTVSINFS